MKMDFSHKGHKGHKGEGKVFSEKREGAVCDWDNSKRCEVTR